MNWLRQLRLVLGLAAFLGITIYAAVLIVDPYDTVWFSPPLDRMPTASNQRFSYPAIARKPRFDSAVIGTSTTRLLRPARLDEAIGGRFVNLAMNSATAWEQSQIFTVFRRRHARPRTVIVGVDEIWCQVGTNPPRFTPRPFPEWMYDDNEWNDLLYLFNFSAMEESVRQLGSLLGLRPSKYGADGYADFLPDESAYDLDRARSHIYGKTVPPKYQEFAVSELIAEGDDGSSEVVFGAHELLAAMLGPLPPETVKILMFVPYHRFAQPTAGSRQEELWNECRRRLVQLAASLENAHVVDFMIDSEITREDTNYWDPQHYKIGVAERLSELLARAVREKRTVPHVYRYLGPG